MNAITTHAPQWIGTGLMGLMLAGSVQADSHGMAKDIVDTAAAAGQFETLVAAVQAADLVDTLKGEGPFTVFAPTDDAFAALPDGTVDDLLKPENQQTLQAILTYHVVPGTVMAEDAMAADSATTVQGQDLTITTMDGQLMVDDATVIQTDIEASNGVIHVIDSVLMPE
ncbi:fasciclin domain-containing protein [Halomonas maura]|uniref:fasciclin domain-containing protein n=1 Tax=Halomonas maura TaxID=117606 RepID=UPI0025B5B0A4|nr:fasciclin domain-containing protein [Halomonas maura]MDN3556420.1 fasciclin domain-containing protein [Halomonas maura]